MKISLIFSSVLLAGLLAGCSPEMDNNVVATVNGQAIRQEKLTQSERSILNRKPTTPEEGDLLQKTLDQIIQSELLLQEAIRQGKTIQDSQLEEMVDGIKEDYPPGAFEEMLIREYVDFDLWKENLKENILIEMVVQSELESRVKIDWNNFETFIQDYIKTPLKPGKAKVRHITTNTRADAEKALSMLESGQKFDEVAKELIGSGNQPEVSQPVWIYPSMLEPGLTEAITETETGWYSRIVETQYGFTIFEVLEVEPPVSNSSPEIINVLRENYTKRQQEAVLAQWVAELRQKAEVKINPHLIGPEDNKR